MQQQPDDHGNDLEPSKPELKPEHEHEENQSKISPPPSPSPSPSPSNPPSNDADTDTDTDTDTSIVDVSGKTLELSLFNGEVSDTAEPDGLYVYRNIFNLLPKCLGSLGTRLKTLKFFANEINLFPAEFNDCLELECLQVKVASLGLAGLRLTKMKSLKKLEISKAPGRVSGFPILAEIAALKSLTKLCVCHFSIRYLPAEIGCLINLEYLDLSFNKMRSLPKEISYLTALITLKVANNKLVELPSVLSSLQRLESLDLSRNRLTSLGLLDLSLMPKLQKINLEYNKLLSCQIPSWVCCNLDGNETNMCSDEYFSSAVEMDVLEGTVDVDGSISYDASSSSSPYHLRGSSLSDKCFLKRQLGKRWKRRQYLQQRSRSTHSKKWKYENHGDILNIKHGGQCGTCKQATLASDTTCGCAFDTNRTEDQSKQLTSRNEDTGSCLSVGEDGDVQSKVGSELKSCTCSGSGTDCDEIGSGHGCSDESTIDNFPIHTHKLDDKSKKQSSSQAKSSQKCKRQPDRILDNPKPRKARRSTDDESDVSQKYSLNSFCGIEDRLPDGFYDAGRDRPFMSLRDYEQSLELHSREVILLDRERDEELDAISLSAQLMVFRLMKLTGSRSIKDMVTDYNVLVASWLALFVSDRFGGSDRSSFLERVRKDVSGSNYHKPFVCTCNTGNNENTTEPHRHVQTTDDSDLRNLCEASLQTIKAKLNSVVVPIGTMQRGVCRHRAILLKYLCDRMEPPVPCELVRGYLDFFPHAWNVILVWKGESWVRMIVDACRPHDIREEMDPEYFSRYIPLSRVTSPVLSSRGTSASCFPTISECKEVESTASRSIIVCNVGSVEAAAKVRTLEVSPTSVDAIRKFELTCLGEVRMLGAVRNHPCIVDIYGHKISSEWMATSDERMEQRLLRSTILMEYVRGGSLKGYIRKLLEAGEKYVPVHVMFCIARDVACALRELHSKHIIHRDVKSENVLIDLEEKRADGSPIVKLSDFDNAVPSRAPLHTCCISHLGIHPPDICVGTPRWMAPEVLRAMNEPKTYGLEIDIWSYGCLLFELLTLQVPYMGLPDSNIQDLLLNGKRPPLTDELKLWTSSDESSRSKTFEEFQEKENDLEGLRFLVDIFHKCTNGNPSERPKAEDLYDTLLERSSSFESAELVTV